MPVQIIASSASPGWMTARFRVAVTSPIVSLDWQVVSHDAPAAMHLGQIAIAQAWTQPVRLGR